MGSQRYVVFPADDKQPTIYVAFKLEDNREEEYFIGDTVDELVGMGSIEIRGVSIDNLKEYNISIRDGIIISAIPA